METELLQCVMTRLKYTEQEEKVYEHFSWFTKCCFGMMFISLARETVLPNEIIVQKIELLQLKFYPWVG